MTVSFEWRETRILYRGFILYYFNLISCQNYTRIKFYIYIYMYLSCFARKLDHFRMCRIFFVMLEGTMRSLKKMTSKMSSVASIIICRMTLIYVGLIRHHKSQKKIIFGFRFCPNVFLYVFLVIHIITNFIFYFLWMI